MSPAQQLCSVPPGPSWRGRGTPTFKALLKIMSHICPEAGWTPVRIMCSLSLLYHPDLSLWRLSDSRGRANGVSHSLALRTRLPPLSAQAGCPEDTQDNSGSLGRGSPLPLPLRVPVETSSPQVPGRRALTPAHSVHDENSISVVPLCLFFLETRHFGSYIVPEPPDCYFLLKKKNLGVGGSISPLGVNQQGLVSLWVPSMPCLFPNSFQGYPDWFTLCPSGRQLQKTRVAGFAQSFPQLCCWS